MARPENPQGVQPTLPAVSPEDIPVKVQKKGAGAPLNAEYNELRDGDFNGLVDAVITNKEGVDNNNSNKANKDLSNVNNSDFLNKGLNAGLGTSNVLDDFESVDDMRNSPLLNNGRDGQTVRWQNYYDLATVPGGGGGNSGIFFFGTPPIDKPDDGGSVFHIPDAVSPIGWVEANIDLKNIDLLKWGVVANRNDSDATQNTSIIQKSIAFIEDNYLEFGGVLSIPSGCRFNMGDLVFSKKQNIYYFLGDNRNQQSGGFNPKDTNELVQFIANANNAGIVNEYIVQAPFNPGFRVSVAKNISGQDTYLGVGQDRLNPARATYVIDDEEEVVYINQWISYQDDNLFTGINQGVLLQRRELVGIGVDDFVTTPSDGDIITSNSSSGRGIFLFGDNSSITVCWIGGRYTVGESVTKDNGSTQEISSELIGSINETRNSANALRWGRKYGEVSINHPPETTFGSYTVGGRSTVTATRSLGQIIRENIVDPVRSWVKSMEDTIIEGKDLAYDVANKILAIRDYRGSVNLGQVGAVTSYTNFNDSATPSISSYNISSITKNGTGDYTLTFTNPLKLSSESVFMSYLNTQTGKPANIEAKVFAINQNVVRVQVFSKEVVESTLVNPVWPLINPTDISFIDFTASGANVGDVVELDYAGFFGDYISVESVYVVSQNTVRITLFNAFGVALTPSNFPIIIRVIKSRAGDLIDIPGTDRIYFTTLGGN